ncbi:MAG TPA: serine hydrolase domain-containing protein [Roseiflexaceae bacterium]|nr:serine hydrolase domain-containing protein [Roseiflexaceae bacterium]
MSLAQQIDSLIHDAIERRIFPGAAVLVARAGVIRHHAAYGTTMYDAGGSRPATTDTIYDVASLTKVFTATAALQLIEQGSLDLQAPVAAYLPEVCTSDVRVIHLLTHTSGLDIRLSALRDGGRDGVLAAVYSAVPVHPPGTVVAYTNVNSLLLGAIVERIRGEPLDSAMRSCLFDPLGLRDTGFLPPAALLPRIAPTEIDEEWRGGLVHGSVHDESAHALGGIAGHAGLFSTTEDLLVFCQSWLEAILDVGFWIVDDKAKIQHPKSRILGLEIAKLATSNHTAGLAFACGLGWMLDRANFMGHAPQGSFGHTGFTGPALVVVPREQLIVVVLSNRVYPRRRPPPYLHHAVTAAIVEAALPYR